MVTFAHIADCHLGCWRQEELLRLNFLSFQKVIEQVISRGVDFVLLAGDLFDSAYPPIEILKESFAEFKKLHDANIPVYLIAGSHDFSASGKYLCVRNAPVNRCPPISNTAVNELFIKKSCISTNASNPIYKRT